MSNGNDEQNVPPPPNQPPGRNGAGDSKDPSTPADRDAVNAGSKSDATSAGSPAESATSTPAGSAKGAESGADGGRSVGRDVGKPDAGRSDGGKAPADKPDAGTSDDAKMSDGAEKPGSAVTSDGAEKPAEAPAPSDDTVAMPAPFSGDRSESANRPESVDRSEPSFGDSAPPLQTPGGQSGPRDQGASGPGERPGTSGPAAAQPSAPQFGAQNRSASGHGSPGNAPQGNSPQGDGRPNGGPQAGGPQQGERQGSGAAPFGAAAAGGLFGASSARPNGPAQNGPAQNGSGQGGPGQGGPAQNGPGPYQPGPGQPQSGQFGPAQNGPAQNGPGQPGPAQPGPGQAGGNAYSSSSFDNGPYGQTNPYQSPTGSGPQTASGPQTGSGPRTGSGPGSSQALPQPAPAPGFAGGTTATSRAAARPTKKKGKLPLFIALGSVLLVLVLVLVGFLVINSVNKNNYGPDTVAEDYVAALNKGDFAAAEKIAPSPRPEGTNMDLLSKNFTDASSAKIENAKVETSQVDGDTGKVTVTYELDGSTYNVDLPAKKDGKQNLFFDKWTLTGPALHVISLDVPAADGLKINGTDYTAQAGTTAFAVYPGNYDFSIPASKWVSEASDTAAANFPQAYAPGDQPSTDQVSPLTLNLALSPTPDFEKEVQKQVEAELNKCFDNKDIKPKCKFIKFDPTQIPVGGTDDKLEDLAKDNTAKWTMKKMPQVKASFGMGDTNTGSFFTETNGSFDFSVDGKAAGSSYFSNDNPLSVSGSVKIEGDKLTVEFFDF